MPVYGDMRIETLHTNEGISTFWRMAKAKPTAKKPSQPKTVQRTYRFDTELFEAFEEDCARRLSNAKRVLEALILHWLDAGPDARSAMAQKHRDKLGASSRDE